MQSLDSRRLVLVSFGAFAALVGLFALLLLTPEIVTPPSTQIQPASAREPAPNHAVVPPEATKPAKPSLPPAQQKATTVDDLFSNGDLVKR
jgi:hypothetical protein